MKKLIALLAGLLFTFGLCVAPFAQEKPVGEPKKEQKVTQKKKTQKKIVKKSKKKKFGRHSRKP